MLLAFSLCTAFYGLFYFVLCRLPVFGFPTFRIDYLAATVTRGDELSDFAAALRHSRPVSALYASFQGAFALAVLEGQTRFTLYLLQHAGLLAYFLAITKMLEQMFRVRLRVLAILAAWAAVTTAPETIEGIYKLETIVGTLSMTLGSFSMLALFQWRKNRLPRWLVMFFLLYCLSVLAKEDFALPPLILLGWLIIEDGIRWQQIVKKAQEYRPILAGLAVFTVFFWIFNKYIILDRSFVSPVAIVDSPYWVSLHPADLVEAAKRYTAGLNKNAIMILLAYVLASSAALLLRRRWRETLIVFLMVLGLMAPYLVMPNHVFGYYAVKWLVVEALTFVALVQLIFNSQLVATLVAVVGSTLLVAPVVSGVQEKKHRVWHVSNYFRDRISISENIHKTLATLREDLNQEARVGVIGMGPGQIDQSPWWNGGESHFYLSGDLQLKPQWILFFMDTVAQRPNILHDDFPDSAVLEVNFAHIGNFEGMKALVFRKDGVGRLVTIGTPEGTSAIDQASGRFQHDTWSVSPGGVEIKLQPQIIADCKVKPQVEVTWDASMVAQQASISIWIVDDGKRKLWLSGASRGKALTGPWGRAGMKFELEATGDQRPLAHASLGGIRCN